MHGDEKTRHKEQVVAEQLLMLKEGDKMLFLQKENGEIVVKNTSFVAVIEAQQAVAGSAYSEEEILSDVMSLRYVENDG